MTVSYSDRFSKLLLRWKGSLWKTIYKDLLIYLFMYYTLSLIYRYAMSNDQQEFFEAVASLFAEYTKQIPLTFLLGFYVGMVVKRWWEQFHYISYPDSLLMHVQAYIRGNREHDITIRRAVSRFALLSCVLAWRSISLRVLRRFPTEEHLLSAGLLTKEEFELFQKIEVQSDPHRKWMIPILWIQSIFVKCFEQRRFSHTNELKSLLTELDIFRKGFLQLFIYDWVSIPLVYTQVATIATYGYFALCLVARQYPTK